MKVMYFDSVASTAEPVFQTTNLVCVLPVEGLSCCKKSDEIKNRNDDESGQRLRLAYKWNTMLRDFIVVSGIDRVIDQQEFLKTVKHSGKKTGLHHLINAHSKNGRKQLSRIVDYCPSTVRIRTVLR